MMGHVHQGATAAWFLSGDPEHLQAWLIRHWNCVYVQAITESGQTPKDGERVLFFVGYWEHLINNYSEIKMLSVLPSHCRFGHGVRTWNRVKGNFSKGFLEVRLGWTCTNCIWTRARSFEVPWPLSIWLSGKAFFKRESPGAHCRFLQCSSEAESREWFFLTLSESRS